MTAVYYRARTKIGVCEWTQVGACLWSCRRLHRKTGATAVGYGESQDVAFADLEDKINDAEMQKLFGAEITSLKPVGDTLSIH